MNVNLSLREYFIGQALAGLTAAMWGAAARPEERARIAEHAIGVADSVLARLQAEVPKTPKA
jgi:hypothetical protein